MSKVLLVFRYMQHDHPAINPEDALDVVKVANVVTRAALRNLQVLDCEFILDKFLGIANVEIYGSDINALTSVHGSVGEIYRYYSMTNPERENQEDQEEDDDLDTTTIEDFDNGFDFFTFVYEKIKEYYSSSIDVTREQKPFWSENVNFAKLLLINV